ncbi:MAG: hypothetical protein ACLTMP_04070 [Eggerthella lenta]
MAGGDQARPCSSRISRARRSPQTAAFAYADFIAASCAAHHSYRLPQARRRHYSQKLEALFASNDIASVTVARMEVPCCGGLEHAARAALERSGKNVPFEVGDLRRARCWSAASERSRDLWRGVCVKARRRSSQMFLTKHLYG